MRRMSLSQVVSGRIDRPIVTVLYGVEGIGKSTFGADAPEPIFLGAEDGTWQLSVARFPQPESWTDVLDAVQELIDTEHSYKTFVLDTLDWAEPLCWAHVCKRYGVAHIDAVGGGFGKGYAAAVDDWRSLLSRLDRLRSVRKMEIILLAHAQVKAAKQPDTEDFDRYQLAMNAKAADVIKQWADVVLFARFETYTIEQNKRAKGVDGKGPLGARVVHTEWRAAWDAKNRLNLPPKLPLNYAAVAQAIRDGVNAEQVRSKIQANLILISDSAFCAKARESLASVGNDGAKLLKLADLVNAKLGSEREKQ